MTTSSIGGAESRVNTTTALGQQASSVAQMTDGSYVVTWTGFASTGLGGIYAQHFSASGAVLGSEVLVSQPLVGTAKDSDVSLLANGGYVVSWNLDLPSGTKFSTHAQRYTIGGAKVGGDIAIGFNATYEQAVSQVGVWNGGFITVWESNNAQPPVFNGYGIHAQLIDSAGAHINNDFRVNVTLLLDQRDPSLATFATSGGVSTGFVVAFETPDISGGGVVARTFDSAATGAAAEFQVNTFQTGEQGDPAVAVLSNGDIVVTWTSTGQDGSGDGVYAQRFTSTGVKIGSETRVNTVTAGAQGHPQIAALADGGYVIVWDSAGQDGSGAGVYLQRYASDGALVEGETLVNSFIAGDQDNPAVSALGSGFVVTWTSNAQDGSGLGVYQKVYGSGVVLGPNADTYVGTSGPDTVDGGAGDDALSGGAGDDRISGGVGADTLTGGSGANYLHAGDGDDVITGGDFFDDTHGNIGNDTVHGGGFDDWVVGGQGNDLLFGDDGSDLCYGQLGTDTIDAGAGDDAVVGGQANDILDGGAGNDYVTGDRGDDTVTGGLGADTFHTNNVQGLDRVTDFSQAQGDKVLVDAGSTYTLSQVGADTLIDMGGGNQMVLVGVQLSTLTTGWITGG